MTFLQDPTVWVLFSFVIFAVAAYKLAWPVVIKGLDARIEKIRAEIQTAEKLKKEAEDLLIEYKNRSAQAEKEAAQMVLAAKEEALEIQKEAEANLIEIMQRRETMMRERISRMEENAMEDIRRYAAELAVSATAQIIVDKMDGKRAESLTDSSIRALQEKMN